MAPNYVIRLSANGGNVEQTLEKIKQKFDNISKSSAPLKNKLRDIQAQLAQMNMDGINNSDVFVNGTKQASEYKDAISDAAQAIRLLSSDTTGLDAGIQIFQGLTGALSIATGAMQMLGIENENVQQSFLKVQSAMALLNGVQQIANILNKDSILMLKMKQLHQIGVTAATGAATVAEGANTAALVSNTIARKAWNYVTAIGKALMGDFTGLAILGAGALLTFALCTSDATEEQEKHNNALTEAKEIHDSYTSSVANNAGELVGKFEQLRTQWNTLRTEEEQVKWLEDNRTAFENLGLGVYDVVTAEKVFNNNTATVIKALEARARAMAAMEAMVDVYKKAYDKKMQYANTVAGGGYYYAAKAGETNNESTLTGEWEGLQENVHWVWQGNGVMGYSRKLLDAGAAVINAKRAKEAGKKLLENYAAVDKESESQLEFYRNEIMKNDALANSILEDMKIQPRPKTNPKTSHNTSSGKSQNISSNAQNRETQSEYDRLRKAAEDAQKRYNEAIAKNAPQVEIDNLKRAYEDAKSKFDEVKERIDEGLRNERESLRYKYEAAASIIEDAKADYEKGIFTKEEFEEAVNKANSFLEENKLNPIAVKIEPAEGSIEAFEKQVSDIDKRLNEENLDVKTRIQLMDDRAKIQEKIDALTHGEVSIKADIEPTYIHKGSIEDKRQSRENADAKVMRIQRDFDSGIINSKEAKRQLFELNNELAGLGMKPIEIQFTGKFDRILEDVNGFSEKLNAQFQAITSIDGIVNAFRSFNDAVKEGKGGWDLFVRAIQIGTSIISAVQSVITAVTAVQSVLNVVTGTATAAQTAKSTADAVSATTAVTTTAAVKAESAAYQELAASEYFAAHAYIPFAGFGIASGFVSGMLAMTKSIGLMGMFADGGIIPGTSFHGDKIMARVNAGEMILNQKQQANLFRLLNNGGTTSGGGKVEFKISGSTLKGVLRNYDNKMNKIKG